MKMPTVALDAQEARSRMARRGTSKISWTLKDFFVEWEYIPATCVCNSDGSSAGMGQEPDRIVLQKKYWANGEMPRYTNYW